MIDHKKEQVRVSLTAREAKTVKWALIEALNANLDANNPPAAWLRRVETLCKELDDAGIIV